MSQPVTKSAFAGLAGVSPAAITKACGKQLAGALTGKFIDVAHPDAVEYLKSRNRAVKKAGAAPKKTKATKTKPAKKARPSKAPRPMDMLPDHIRQYADMSLNSLIDIFGTDTGFKAWLEAAEKIEKVIEKQIKNASSKGDLVSKTLVEGLLGLIERFHVQLLTDGSKRMAQRCETKVKAGATVVECELLIRKEIEKFLKPMKDRIKKALADV